MKRHTVIIPLFLLLTALLLSVGSPAVGRSLGGYSKDNPLVIVSDWDFLPFEYQTSDGKPAGYNVEILDIILNRLDIPHKFVMQEWYMAAKLFERRDADLIHAMSYNYSDRPYYMTKKFVNYYTMLVARKVTTPPLHRLSNLGAGDTLILKKNDYAELYIKSKEGLPFAVDYHPPKYGLSGIRSGKFKYMVWGETPLTRKIQELRLDSITVDEIDIPAGELHIIGYDKQLIELIDEEYTRLEQAGDLQKVYDKWFRPNRIHDDESPLSLLLVCGLLAVAVFLILLSRLLVGRVKAAVAHSADINNIMKQALSMTNHSVILYDANTWRISNVYGNLLPAEGMTPEEFMSRIDCDSQASIRDNIARSINGEVAKWNSQVLWNAGTDSEPRWCQWYGNAQVEADHGKPRFFVCTIRDNTAALAEEKHNQEMGNRYMKIFDTNLVAMSFYSADGMLLDLNDRMKELCGIDERSLDFFYKTSLFETPLIKGVMDPARLEMVHICQHMNYPELNLNKFVELRIRPVFNDGGQLIYYIVTSRDVTAERQLYLDQRDHERQLRAAQAAIGEYDRQLVYLLEENKMFVWHYNIAERTIHFTRTLNSAQYSETLEEYMSGMSAESAPIARRNLEEAVLKGKPFTAMHHFDRTPLSAKSTWYSISGIPIVAADGKTHEYFGVVRDMTELMEAQQQLRYETARAEDSGKLKSVFLANMTHEIRTPLNAIVGFSDLLQTIDNEEERQEFIRIIHNNCDMLLRLINDILAISNVDANAMQLLPETVDFAQSFNDICQTLSGRVTNPDIEFQKENPCTSLVVTVDIRRLWQVVTNFVTNAVKYTTKGHIKVGYRVESGADGVDSIYVFCEDTGTGIPKEQCPRVFERFVKLNDFVQGTGLGLAICKAIIDKCGGTIGVDSEVGQGSTFWFRIPVEVSGKR